MSCAVKSQEQVVDTRESARLAALRSYRILDTDPEQAFDDLVLLASQICGTPISLITLVDEDRQWFKARVGVSIAETSRSVSFCSHAIKGRGIFVVADALEDVRFRENPMVQGEPHIRFYAGAPLMTSDGHALGTLCIVDHMPRTLTDGQRRALEALRRQTEALLELRRNLIDLGKALAERDRAEAAKDPNWPPKISEFVQTMRSEIVVPFPFVPEVRPGTMGPIFEVRYYTLKAGSLPEVAKGWEAKLPERMKRSPVVLAGGVEFGRANGFVHIWAYSSLEQRAKVRADAVAAGIWPPPGGGDRLLTQENKIVMPAAFSPLQ